VELGQQDYSTISRLNGKPTAIIAIYQLPGSNALQTAEGIRKLMAQMKDRLPEDVDYAISLDQTLPVSEGMREVVETLVIAILLVILVVYLFLQDWRATLIPMLAVPVSLVGTFVLFPLFGFSINTLSMLGLVLAIGLVVDDAIVVVEACNTIRDAPRQSPQRAGELSIGFEAIALVPAFDMCCTPSTTTIASSTTRPIARTRPNIESVLIEKPNSGNRTNVPTSETGTAA